MSTPDRDELRQLAKQLLDYDTCHDGVVDQAAEVIPALLDQLAAAEAERDRLRTELTAEQDTCQAAVVTMEEATRTLLERRAELDTERGRVARLTETLQAVVSAGESYHRGDDALIVLPRAVWIEASAALRVLEDPAC